MLTNRPRPALGLRLAAASAAVAAIATYAASLRVGFYSDDYTWLGRMPATVLRPMYMFSIFYRDFNPLLHLSFVADWLAGGGSPIVFHATSLAVHAASAALLVALCTKVSGNLAAGWIAGITWALNVRISEAVIWPAARGHALATVFLLASLVCLISGYRRRVAISAVLFALALMSKEVAVFPIAAAPLLLGDRSRRSLLDCLPHWVLAAGFAVFSTSARPPSYSPLHLVSMALKLPFVLLRPLGLGDYYDFTPYSLVLFSVAFLMIIYLLRTSRVAIAGFLWIGLVCVPVVPLEKLSSRYLYLLSIGYALILSAVIARLAPHVTSVRARGVAWVGTATALALIIAANVVSVQREIEDYALLARPYEMCLERLKVPAFALTPGETLVVADTSPRDAVPAMYALVRARGSMTKLIPFRERAVEGLVDLASAVNIIRGSATGLAIQVPLDPAASDLVYIDDGSAVRPTDSIPDVPPDRLSAVRLATPSEYFGAAQRRP